MSIAGQGTWPASSRPSSQERTRASSPRPVSPASRIRVEPLLPPPMRPASRLSPLVGPSSLLLALSASGLDGQRFSFLGYLPQERMARRAALQSMDRGIHAEGATRIFIETPYRNDRLLEDCLGILSPDTRLCVAASLSTPAERIRSAPVSEWRKSPSPIGKEPAVFLAGRRASLRVQEEARPCPASQPGQEAKARRATGREATDRDPSRPKRNRG